jgi:hypothetical protein
VNVPHKEYWSRPENEPRLRSLIAQDGWVCADLTLGLLIAVAGITIVQAHAPEPDLGLSGIALVVLFVVLILGYLLRARRRYRPEVQ